MIVILMTIVVAGLVLIDAVVLAQPNEFKQDYTLGTVIGQIVILVTTIAGFIYTIYRENRNRRWDLEDRERARQELARKVEEQQRAIETRVAREHRTLMSKLEENTNISSQARTASNSIDEKIAELTRMFLQSKTDPADSTVASEDPPERGKGRD